MNAQRRSLRPVLRLAATVLLAFFGALHAQAAGKVVVLDVKGAIGVPTAEYLESGFEHARDTGADLVVLRLDTPGGLLSSTRDIIQSILSSPVPVATYVSPSGARADSAGTYILLASHVAAMAPTTHIGAATPVSITGEGDLPAPMDDAPPVEEPADESDPESAAEDADEAEPAESRDASPNRSGSAMDNKVLNDAIAYIRSLAERHGRNADWAESAVRDAATLTANEALEQNVIEIIADDIEDLLGQIDGREVNAGGLDVTLAVAGADIETFEPSWRLKLLSVLANPEVVLILGMIGLYGLMYEGWNPGAIVPGVVGVICLLLAAYGLQVLPVNYAGLALLIVGVALMVAEAFAPSFGALGLGGIIAFVIGAIIMFDAGVPGYGISLAFVAAVAVSGAAAIVWSLSYILKLRRRGAVSGKGSIEGGVGTAMSDFTGDGKVWLEGEAWAAHSTESIRDGQAVRVLRMEGLTLHVEPLTDTATPPPLQAH